MKFSVWASANQLWPQLLDLALFADNGPWHSVYVADHFMARDASPTSPGRPIFEATAVLAALAQATSRIRLSPIVLSMTYRHPAVLANWVCTVDHVSDGRLTLGLGAGWQENEHEAYGIALGTPKERVDRFAEGLPLIASLLSQTSTSGGGNYYQLRDAVNEPKPLQQKIPLLVGASGPRMLSLAAQYADEWNTWSAPGQFRRAAEPLDRACEKLGRDPASVHRSTQAWFFLDDQSEDYDDRLAAFHARTQELPGIRGNPQQIAEAISVWREEGVDEVIIRDDFLGTGTRREDNYAELWDAFHTV